MLREGRFLVFSSLLFFLSCSVDNPLSNHKETSEVNVHFLVEKSAGETRGNGGLAKSAVISRVEVTVSASDMETVKEDLTVSSDGKTATGSVEVPKGNARKFDIEAIDANGITQYSGSATQDILGDVETVSITTKGYYPDPVSLTVGTVSLNSVELTWTQNSDVDFNEYEIYRSTTATVDLNSTLITTISGRTNTSYTDGTINLNAVYYYRIIVWDTEGLGFWGSTQKAPAELGYDDNSFEIGLIGTEQNESLIVLFSAPSYPIKLISLEMFLKGTHLFTTAVFDQATGTFLGGESTTGVNADNYEWGRYDIDHLNLTVSGDFYAGVRYTGSQQTDGFWWPAIGLDQTSSAGRSYDDLPQTGKLELLDNIGYPGNLGVRVVAEVEGTLMRLTSDYSKVDSTALAVSNKGEFISSDDAVTKRHVPGQSD